MPGNSYISRVRDDKVAPTPAPPDQRVVKMSVLDAKKPVWQDKAELWTDLHILYQGGHLFKKHATRFLRMRPKEDGTIYSARLNQVTYQDLLGTGLGWYAAELFEMEPDVGIKQEQPEGPGKDVADDVDYFYHHKFLKNCDRNRTSFSNFWRDVTTKMLTFGEVWVLVDLPKQPKPDSPDAPRNLLEQMRGGYFDPYMVAYDPLQVINYQEDEEGQLKWCVVKVSRQIESFLGPPQLIDRWYYFDQEMYRVYEHVHDLEEEKKKRPTILAKDDDPDVPMVDEGLHPLAAFHRCPIKRYVLPEHLWIANRAYLPILDHLNQDNTLTWALFMANLAMPVIIGDVDLTNQMMTEAGFIQLPEGSSYKWTEPEGKSFQISQARVNQLREEIFRAMYLVSQGKEMSGTGAHQSGFSRQMEMASSTDILDSLGSVIIQGMQNMLIDVSDARGDERLVFDVRGFHFEQAISLQDIQTIDQAINMIIPSETFEKELYRLIARAFLRDANPELFERVVEEIEAGETRLARQKSMMEFSANLGLKPVSYDRLQGSQRRDDPATIMTGTPTKNPQQAAGAARSTTKVQKKPTTKPPKKAN